MKFYIHKLGCPKNDVDADYMAARLIAEGHEPAAAPEQAESVIVNTCGFIVGAKKESITEIMRLGKLKKEATVRTLYATGCLTQRYGDELLEGIPELDGAFGHGALDSLASTVTSGTRHRHTIKRETRQLGYLTWKDRYISDGLPYAYLKISDGCDRSCTYCSIPLMRGTFRSRPIESILREAEFLAANGKKELILVSQEATMYGYGLPGAVGIIDLLKALERVEGIRWIRLLYLYPPALGDDLIEYLCSDSKTLPYFDLPLQHVNTEILSRMRRRLDRPALEALLERIRRAGPHATIRTTFIVGFPGETRRQFGELRDFVERHRFDRMGVFPYSPEEETPAAGYAGQVSERTRQRRLEQLMLAQAEIAFERNRRLIGSMVSVMVDTVDAQGTATARTAADCPEIDQEVTVTGPNLRVGDIRTVRITGENGYDLQGVVLEEHV